MPPLIEEPNASDVRKEYEKNTFAGFLATRLKIDIEEAKKIDKKIAAIITDRINATIKEGAFVVDGSGEWSYINYDEIEEILKPFSDDPDRVEYVNGILEELFDDLHEYAIRTKFTEELVASLTKLGFTSIDIEVDGDYIAINFSLPEKES